MATILCVDDDPGMGRTLRLLLEGAGHQAVVVSSVPEGFMVIEKGGVDLIISDFQMPGINGIEFLSMLASEGVDVPLIMLTGFASIDHAVASIRAGAADYLPKPFEREQLELAVYQALNLASLRRENTNLKRAVTELRSEREILGESAAIRKAVQTAAMAARTRSTVLLQGESGTGKELFAGMIHSQSDRSDRPFIKLNCAALPEGLIESALFGHEKGAFTGAFRRVEGAFERAHTGTLLLDEVSEMRLDLQTRLLRVLQEQEFERVGGSRPIKVDVRFVATTNRNLMVEVAAGRFREDLYYRLSVLPIHIPSLGERLEDIPFLAARFAMRASAETGKPFSGFTPKALVYLQARSWPGNVRELEHAVHRAVIFSSGPMLDVADFASDSPGVLTTAASPREPIASGDAPVVLNTLNVAEAERVLIGRALEATAGNRTHAARLLGISVRALRNKLNVGTSRKGNGADNS